MVTELSSYNNRTRVSYPRCSSPLMELVICSTPSTDHQRGWSQVSLESFHPKGPPLLSLCSRLAPSASILSSSFYPSEKAEETLEKSIQPNGKPGVGEGATYLLPSISKVWGRAQRNGPQEPSGTPIPLASLIYTPPLHTALEELGLPQGGGFPPSSLIHTLPPQLPGPLIGTPYSPSLPPLWL